MHCVFVGSTTCKVVTTPRAATSQLEYEDDASGLELVF